MFRVFSKKMASPNSSFWRTCACEDRERTEASSDWMGGVQPAGLGSSLAGWQLLLDVWGTQLNEFQGALRCPTWVTGTEQWHWPSQEARLTKRLANSHSALCVSHMQQTEDQRLAHRCPVLVLRLCCVKGLRTNWQLCLALRGLSPQSKVDTTRKTKGYPGCILLV